MEKAEKRIKLLNKAADMICRSAYVLCKNALKKDKEKPPDAKELKDVCAAVKEAIAIAVSLDRSPGENSETLKIVMDSVSEKMAQ